MHTRSAIADTATVNEIIRLHPATVGVFNDFAIDACCGGAATLRQAAARDGADVEQLLEALNRAAAEPAP